MRNQSLGDDEDRPLPIKKEFSQTHPRIRSGSGTTTTSESADETALHVGPMSLSSSSSISSSQPSGASSNSLNRRTPPRTHLHSAVTNNSSEFSKFNAHNPSAFSAHTHSILSPIATRVLANDAGAMAEYMKRNRSGSQGETPHHVIVEPSSTNTGRASGSKGSTGDPLAQKYTLRRLRPSISAAALNQPSTVPTGFRFRAGTNPSNSRPSFTTQPSAEAEDALDRPASNRGGALPSLQEPSEDSPPRILPPLPPKDSSFHQRGPSLS